MRELGELVRRSRLLVFDFDGTLVDSNPIKRRAFEACFAPFQEHRDAILSYCVQHHHTPRQEKFRYVYERILGRAYTQEAAARLQERFEAHTTRQIIEAPEIPGAARFLQRVSGLCETALLSSTPDGVLREIVLQRRWAPYFGEIQGAPVDKTAWLEVARRARGLPDGRAIVCFGDTQEDAEAAEAAGCPFVLVGKDGGDGMDTIPDFLSLMVEDAAEPFSASRSG